jgi:hypothetical protein
LIESYHGLILTEQIPFHTNAIVRDGFLVHPDCPRNQHFHLQ